ncbi:unnamed protein product, partial [Nesidiocoris tenuis]
MDNSGANASLLPYRVSAYGDFLRYLEGLNCPPFGHYHYHNGTTVGPPLPGIGVGHDQSQDQCPVPGLAPGVEQIILDSPYLGVPHADLDTTPPASAFGYNVPQPLNIPPRVPYAAPPPGNEAQGPPFGQFFPSQPTTNRNQSQHAHNASIQGGNNSNESMDSSFESFRPLHTSSFMEGQEDPRAPAAAPTYAVNPPMNQSIVNPFPEFGPANLHLDSMFETSQSCPPVGAPQAPQAPAFRPPVDPNHSLANPFLPTGSIHFDSTFDSLAPESGGVLEAGYVSMSQQPVAPLRRSLALENACADRLNRSLPEQSQRSDEFPIQTVSTEIEWPCVMLNGKGIQVVLLKNKSYVQTETIVIKIAGEGF